MESEKKENYRNYQLDRFKDRLEFHATSPKIKDLRDEIAICRMVLESTLNGCADNFDLHMKSKEISELLGKINLLVNSCHKLEGSMGQLLDKQTILHFATKVVDILSEELQDQPSDKLNDIAKRVLDIVGELNDQQDDNS